MNKQLNSTKAASLIELETGRSCSRQNLEKLCRAGRLPNSCLSLRPIRLNSETLIDEYLGNIDSRQQNEKCTTRLDFSNAEDPSELKKRIDRLPDDSIPDLNESRARREHYQAELAKLQVTQQRGDLVPAEQVKKDAFNVGRAVREALSNLADRLSHQLAGETDPVVIHKLISDEHRAALSELAGGEG